METIVSDEATHADPVPAEYRDRIIRTVTDSEARLLRELDEIRLELAETRADRDSYRELLSMALAQLHSTTSQYERLRESSKRLVAASREARQERRRSDLRRV